MVQFGVSHYRQNTILFHVYKNCWHLINAHFQIILLILTQGHSAVTVSSALLKSSPHQFCSGGVGVAALREGLSRAPCSVFLPQAEPHAFTTHQPKRSPAIFPVRFQVSVAEPHSRSRTQCSDIRVPVTLACQGKTGLLPEGDFSCFFFFFPFSPPLSIGGDGFVSPLG